MPTKGDQEGENPENQLASIEVCTNPEILKEKLAMFERILKEKTTATLAKSKLVTNFQKYKENAKVKTWKQVHQFEKSQVAGIKLEAEQIKKENNGLNQELTRLRRALE